MGEAAASSLRPDLEPSIQALPAKPGVYVFRDRRGRVLYVGKAKNLRSRVRSYFRAAGDGRFNIQPMRRAIARIEPILTGSEQEALLLEDTLIKEHRPRYNVRLRDDKSYLYVRLRLDDPFPFVETVRRPKDDGNPIFGPFPSAAAARKTVHVLHQVFPLRACSNAKFSHRSRPCLDHQIGRCPAPCVGLVSEQAYGELVAGARRFLAGDRAAVVRDLNRAMDRAAADLRYEDAAVLRDRIRSLEHTDEAQHVVRFGRESADYWGIAVNEGRSAVVVLRSVAGSLVHTDRFPGLAGSGGELDLAQLLLQYYGGNRPIPERVYVPGDLDAEERAALEAILRDRRGKTVAVQVPQRGDARRLLELAGENAGQLLKDPAAEAYEAQAGSLAKLLKLPRPPLLIECYDVSVHQGSEPVGVGIAFLHGSEDPQRRRRYRLTPGEGQGDVQWLREMLERRLRRGIREDDLPDLIVLDGGIAQLNAIVRLYEELEIEWVRVPLVALAKDRAIYGDDDAEAGPSERVFLPGRRNPVVLKPGTAAFRLLVGLRDATHNAAVGYHRHRGRNRLLEGLEQVPGVGPARRRRLLDAYPDLNGLATDPPETIARAAGIPRGAARKVREIVQQLQGVGSLATLKEESHP